MKYIDITQVVSIIRAASDEYRSAYHADRIALAHDAPWKARCWDWRRPHEGTYYGITGDITESLRASDTDIRGTVARWASY